MTTTTTREVRWWRKSTHSNPNGACAEVGSNGTVISVRDTRQEHLGNRTVLMFSTGAWREFITGIKGR